MEHPSPPKKALRLLAATLVLGAGVLAQSFHVASPLVEEYRLGPGESLGGQLVLANNTDAPLVVRLSLGDYLLRPDGVQFTAPGTHSRSSAPWIALSQAEVTLPPRGQTAVSFRVQVPNRSDLKGTYFSALLVEGVEPEPQAPQGGGQNTVGVGVVQRLRYAVQVLVNILDTGEPRISFPRARILTEGERNVLEVEVSNTGDRYLRPLARLELFRDDGTPLGSFQEGPFTLPPDSGLTLRLPFPKLAPGTYQAALVLDGGGAFVFGKRYRFTLKE